MEPGRTSDSEPFGPENISTEPKAPAEGESLAQLLGSESPWPEVGPNPPEVISPVLPPAPAKGRRRSLPWLMLTGVKLVLPLAVLASLCFNYSEVRGASMMPGIADHDRILVDHVTYAFAPVERGDVIVLRYPLDPSMDYIKRVVGLPGDEVVIQHGAVWVNGDPVEEPYVNVKSLDPFTSVRTTVKEGHYFVLGDNRIRSSDSREFGQVRQELVRGLVRLRVWPPQRIGWIH